MPIPKDKDELLKAIVDNYKKLTTELANIPIDLSEKKELDGHSKNTQMSINNLVAYLIGWGQLVLKWNDKKSKGLEVDFPDTGYKWNELGLLAQKFYKDYEKDDLKTLNEKLDKTTNEILKLIESKTNRELYETAWYDKWTLGKMIQLNTSSPFKNAKDRIRKWKKIKQLK
ncbi:MAG: DfsB family protein [Bacteroidetes bacterium]|nr:MAG: DfsB family protein [Bacteroidota bacterium]REK34626.1 MAG: DfsB family protein [Bacteroidota bacterium]